MRLAVDPGTVRIGVARSDPRGVLATPLTVVRRGKGDLNALAALAAAEEAMEILVGLPRSLSGREGPAAATARQFAADLADRVAPLPVRLVDERFTTSTAHDALRAGGHDSRAPAADGRRGRRRGAARGGARVRAPHRPRARRPGDARQARAGRDRDERQLRSGDAAPWPAATTSRSWTTRCGEQDQPSALGTATEGAQPGYAPAAAYDGHAGQGGGYDQRPRPTRVRATPDQAYEQPGYDARDYGQPDPRTRPGYPRRARDRPAAVPAHRRPAGPARRRRQRSARHRRRSGRPASTTRGADPRGPARRRRPAARRAAAASATTRPRLPGAATAATARAATRARRQRDDAFLPGFGSRRRLRAAATRVRGDRRRPRPGRPAGPRRARRRTRRRPRSRPRPRPRRAAVRLRRRRTSACRRPRPRRRPRSPAATPAAHDGRGRQRRRRR